MSISAIGSGSALDATALIASVSRQTETETETAATGDQPLDREAEKLAEQEEAERQAREARMQYIRDYIETAGAPEEKDQDAADELFWDKLQKLDDKPNQGLPLLANRTWANVLQDPDDQGKVHVYTIKTNAKAEAKITRHVQFDSGDGQDRAQLTRQRAQAAKAYAHHSTASRSRDERLSEKD